MGMNILDVFEVSKSFFRGGRKIQAVQGVSLSVGTGESVGLVGESGCGKSTLARLITRLDTPDAGNIFLCGKDITCQSGAALRKSYDNIKMIFQEPRSSFDPRFTLGASIKEALRTAGPTTQNEIAQEVFKFLNEAGLDESYAGAYPQDVSGGECQRAAIARAIAAKPRLLICDEATSALDVSVQAQILELLWNFRQKNDMSFLFISHDLALVSVFCERVYAMYEGRIVENGPTSQIIDHPQNEYTQKLIASALQFSISQSQP
jgi:peptide/nickel transport system ATP-binding protein